MTLKNQLTNTPFFLSLLKVDNVVKRFGGLIAVDNVSFAVNKGTIIGIIGPNGAGKTTLFNVITGVLKPDGGKIFFKGRDITGLPPHKLINMGIGRTFQIPRIFREMSVLENMLVPMIGRKMKREYAVEKAVTLLKMVNLHHLLDSPAIELSVGQQKLLEIMMTLMLDAEVLLLDEPFSGVNPLIRDKMVEFLKNFKEKGGTVVLISHDIPSTMKLCEKVLVMNQGKLIAEGTPMEVSKNPDVIEAYLGVQYD
jgi:branched-chain amino acid transport system ATP-binding protein